MPRAMCLMMSFMIKGQFDSLVPNGSNSVCDALSTVLYEPNGGFYLLDRHIKRLTDAHEHILQQRLSDSKKDDASSLNWCCVVDELWRAVNLHGSNSAQRLRVVIDAHGRVHISSSLLPSTSIQSESAIVFLDTQPTTCLTLHKSTDRLSYNRARERVGASLRSPGSLEESFDVLMWNNFGYITETSIANFAMVVDGHEGPECTLRYVTPRLSSGLIRGVMREELLSNGDIVEGDIAIDDIVDAIQRGRRTIVFNAVRKVLPVRLVLPPSLPMYIASSQEIRPLGPGVIIDCWDSFTNNLIPLLNVADLPAIQFEAYLAKNVAVIRLDTFTWETFRDHILPRLAWVIVSPGPGSPDNERDFGFCAKLLREADVPILGVCLGHQGLASAYGGRVIQSQQLMHGQPITVRTHGQGLFEGLRVMQMVRYNSLCVDLDSLPPDLRVTAWSRSENTSVIEIMALQHRTKPLFGVQFHLESACSDNAASLQLIHNFARVVQGHRSANLHRPRPLELPELCRTASYIDFSKATPPSAPLSDSTALPVFEVISKAVDLPPFPSAVFSSMVGLAGDAEQRNEFWLDSARTSASDPYSRFSYMGISSKSLSYANGKVSFSSEQGVLNHDLPSDNAFWDWLDAIQKNMHSKTRIDDLDQEPTSDFKCGFVGYFGYEMGRESLPGYAHSARQPSSAVPGAQFLLADRALAFDHHLGGWRALGLVRAPATCPGVELEEISGWRIGCTQGEFDAWVAAVEDRCRLPIDAGVLKGKDALPAQFCFDQTREDYVDTIRQVKDLIARGESYEMNVTGQFRARLESPLTPQDLHALYLWFRARNPASHSAYVSFPRTKTHILSMSPELFMRLDGKQGRHAVMKPIKGTLRRTLCTCRPICKNPVLCEMDRAQADEQSLQEFKMDPKERAENLMIVDLIKADLQTICRTSTVRVDKLMALETYETVHSLVTTVEGELVLSLGPVEAIKRSFPPGSMTGAPKLRTVQLLEELEAYRPRGVYSGCLGYLSVDNKAAFSVVIRTLVIRDCEASVGAGGAVTWLSDAGREWEEMLLKARSILQDRVTG